MFCFKQKTAYEMRISDWSSDVCSSDLLASPMLNHPLTSMMFCAPDEGAAALVMCRAEIADRYTDNPIFVRASEIRTRSYGAYEVNTSWAAIEEEDRKSTRLNSSH